MRDDRWDDAITSIESAERHFVEALAMFDEGALSGRDRATYRRQMAFMHAMTAGYTSFEAALLRALSILGEDKPTGEDWHAQLLERASRETAARPAIIPKDQLRHARKIKAFRHWSLHGYDDDFEPDDAAVSVEAVRRLLPELRATIERFAAAVDP